MFVIPAEAGIQSRNFNSKMVIINWIPAFAGMTHLAQYNILAIFSYE